MGVILRLSGEVAVFLQLLNECVFIPADVPHVLDEDG